MQDTFFVTICNVTIPCNINSKINELLVSLRRVPLPNQALSKSNLFLPLSLWMENQAVIWAAPVQSIEGRQQCGPLAFILNQDRNLMFSQICERAAMFESQATIHPSVQYVRTLPRKIKEITPSSKCAENRVKGYCRERRSY